MMKHISVLNVERKLKQAKLQKLCIPLTSCGMPSTKWDLTSKKLSLWLLEKLNQHLRKLAKTCSKKPPPHLTLKDPLYAQVAELRMFPARFSATVAAQR